MKQSESFNASLNKDIIDLSSETKMSPDTNLMSNYKILNYDENSWKDLVKEKQRSEHRGRESLANYRINSAQLSKPFIGVQNMGICMSISKKRNAYRIGEMSAPGSASYLNVQLGSSRRNKRNLNSNVKIPSISHQEACVPIKLEANEQNFLNWKAIAINSSDLDEKEKETLGFSPSYVEDDPNSKVVAMDSNFKSKLSESVDLSN